MNAVELKKLLDAQTDTEFVDKTFFSSTPWIFANDRKYQEWRDYVTTSNSLPTNSIWIVGSGATGYSLSPLKPARAFKSVSKFPLEASDIDLAIVNEDLFNKAWNIVVEHDRLRSLHRSKEQRERLRQNIYWGTIDNLSIPLNTDISRSLALISAACSREPPLRGYKINYRVYRRFEDLRAYQIESLRHLKAALTEH